MELKTSIVVVTLMQNVKTNKKQTAHVDGLVPCHSRLQDEAESLRLLRRLVHVAALVN